MSSPRTEDDTLTEDRGETLEDTDVESEPAAPVRIDGRRARRERSRQAVVDALLALLREGQPVPSVRDVAERAGVTERTLFNLYQDKTTLLAAAVARFREQAIAAMPGAPSGGPLEERVERFFEPFARFVEEYSAVRWAAMSQPELAADMRRGVILSRVRARMADLLAPDGLILDDDSELDSAIQAAVDPLTWRQLRVQQQLSLEQARRVVVRSVIALARDALARGAGSR